MYKVVRRKKVTPERESKKNKNLLWKILKGK
jgi:hypothetical protein